MWQALIPAAASIIGGIIGNKASKKAAKQQIKAQQEAINTMGQYLGPYAQAGQAGIPAIQNFVNEGANFADTQAYKDITNASKAGGQFGSGNRATALTDYYATNFRPQRLNELGYLYQGGLGASQAMAEGIGGLQQNIGDARAAGTLGSAQNWTSVLGSLGGLNFNSLLNRNNLTGLGGGYGPSYNTPYAPPTTGYNYGTGQGQKPWWMG